uniref:transcriptional protein SWT1 n=1 Tax=Scatophagus argus TaxID=75038 RepID=UPI001ED7E4EE|nr:transcriptional protein SWT1 [Scatophagus argus]XP_046248070.1 transcriptional protein SWT1 [Scatophagus argus]XP_046248071.1 transcriptional protein SWT1 [Scatophagus argus]
MGKKSKKRKRKKSSSSSSEEDKKASKKHDTTKNYRSANRKHDVNSQESCAAKRESCAFPTIEDASQSARQIKRPVYRLEKTQATDRKPANKEEERTRAKTSVLFHEGNCSSKAKNYISGKYHPVSGSTTVERGSSTYLSTNTTVAAPQRTVKTLKGSLNEKSSQRSSSKLMSPSLVSAEQREQPHNVLKRKYKAEEPPRTRKDSNTIKTKEPSKSSSISKDYLWQKRGELVKDGCQLHQKNKFEATRSLCTEAKAPCASATKESSTAKQTTSASSSKAVKTVTSVPGNVNSVSHKTAKSSSAQQQMCSIASPLPLTFKIPKTVPSKPVDGTNENNVANRKLGTQLSNSGASLSSSKQEVGQQTHSCFDGTPAFSSEGQTKMSSLSGHPPPMLDAIAEPWDDEMKVVEKLHLARSERTLEVNVMQSYGELTCMDIDPPEEGAAGSHCKQPPHQDLILVLDTNILLSHLDYVKRVRSHGLGAMGSPVVLIPWVVLQEMDSLKRGKGLSGSVAHLAIPAISYIYNSLKNREPDLWGQSMQQAAESSNALNAENNDDRVLQCCLQYQSLYPECALILCTNDKNLCSKALLSGVKAFSKNDLEAEVGRSRHGFCPLQNIKPHMGPQVTSSMLSTNYTSVQPHSQPRTGPSVGLTEEDNKPLTAREVEERTKCDPSRHVSELEDCLREVLSDVLEVEMKAAYENLWLEIVYLKPPWTLHDVLQCLKKHWIAVFGQIVPRRKQQTVLNLIDFFNSGKTVDLSATFTALQEAKELVKAFEKSSRRVPGALSVMDTIFNKLQPQGEFPACDVVMNDDDDGDKQSTSTQVSHQEVWTLFENIWSKVCQISLEVFKALGFDPHTMRRTQPAGGPPPPHDALVYLHKLSSMVSQLLQSFSSVLSSAPGLVEVHTLLSVIHSLEIVQVDSRLTAKDLLDCFSQQDYREKLRLGGNQLMELKGALDRCQHITFTA